MKRKALIFIVPLIIAAAVAAVLYRRSERTEPGTVRVSGNIEATTVDLSFRIPGWVESREVDEGHVVKRDQVVARLDARELSRQVEVARAEESAARAALAELEAGTRPQQIEAGRATLRSAEAEAENARVEYERQKSLYESDVATLQAFQRAEAAYKVAQARVDEARQNLKLLEEGPRAEEIDQARARLQAARESLALAQLRLSYATVASPIAAVVLSKNVEPGEYVAAGTPIVTLGDLENVWLRAYISETDLGRVKHGQSARVTTDTYPDKVYQGRVSFIASEAEFTPKNVETHKERVKLVYRVKIDIPNPSLELKPGMPADAVIETAEAK